VYHGMTNLRASLWTECLIAHQHLIFNFILIHRILIKLCYEIHIATKRSMKIVHRQGAQLLLELTLTLVRCVLY
jgi:hypothetical protein